MDGSMAISGGGTLRLRLTLMIKNAFRENLIPGLAIQVFALLLVGSYYLVPPVNAFWNSLATYKSSYSLLFAMGSTALFGGLIPFIYQYLSGKAARGGIAANVLFVLIFWAWKGGEVELFYRFQAWLFGDACTVGTIAAKMVFDQFVYNPVWAAHTVAIGLLWQHCGFDFRATARELKNNYWGVQFPGVLISTWLVWIPAVSIIYCLPQSLQVPLFNLVLCFFVLLASSLKKA